MDEELAGILANCDDTELADLGDLADAMIAEGSWSQ